MTLAALLEFFLLGVATPLTAACVLPLYPAFIAYLGSLGDRGSSVAVLGALVVAGVLAFMALIGIIYTAVLGVGVNNAVETISPAAFLAFGLGIGAPLLAFAVLAQPFGDRVTRSLARHSGLINRVTGLILIVVAGYYLVVVFTIIPVPLGAV